MPERGSLYRWPRSRSFGDTKARPVLVISPEAAHAGSTRLEGHLLAVALDPTPANGLQQRSYAMTWHPTSLDRINLDGPLGRLTPEQLSMVLERIAAALDLTLQEPMEG